MSQAYTKSNFQYVKFVKIHKTHCTYQRYPTVFVFSKGILYVVFVKHTVFSDRIIWYLWNGLYFQKVSYSTRETGYALQRYRIVLTAIMTMVKVRDGSYPSKFGHKCRDYWILNISLIVQLRLLSESNNDLSKCYCCKGNDTINRTVVAVTRFWMRNYYFFGQVRINHLKYYVCKVHRA